MRLYREAVKAYFQKVSVIPDLGQSKAAVPSFWTTESAGPMGISASEARKSLLTLIEQVNNDRQAIEITSKRGDAVLMSRADYLALEETAHLLRSPANARHLLESLEQARRCP
jgi:antitoxin YefM